MANDDLHVLSKFEKQFNEIAYKTGHDAITVFDDLLTYIIGYFNPERKPNKEWRYTKEQNMLFYNLMGEWLNVMSVMTNKLGWYDAFGDFFMSNVGKTSQQYRGQFFTPQSLCDLVASVTVQKDVVNKEPTVYCGAFGKRIVINDCACGSARLLLSAHYQNCKDNVRACYYVAEDIDRLCCKMAAVNMMAHGCFGEVVCHDTLTDPTGIRLGYIINEGLYPFKGIPTIREFTDEPTRFVCIKQRLDFLKMPDKEEADKILETATINLFNDKNT